MAMVESVRGLVQGLRLGAGLWRRARACQRGDERAQQAAEAWMAGVLGREHGPLAKVGQMLAGRMPGLDGLCERADPLPPEEAWELLAAAWDTDPAEHLASWGPAVAAASLGQVHQARLHDGRVVAVKIQYPGLRARCRGVMAALGLLPGVGPLRRYGVDLEAHRLQLMDILEQELDYSAEAERQASYAAAYPEHLGLCVPQPLLELCRSSVLVQTWEEGVPLAQAGAWPRAARQAAGRRLLGHALCGLACGLPLHADPHAGNLRLRPEGLLLYDFGCCTTFSGAQPWLRLILSLRARDHSDALALFAAMGFDAEKLSHLEQRLPRLAQILCAPFLGDAPWDCRVWQPGAEIRTLLGDQAWWFRAAGGSSLLLPMRVYSGVLGHLRLLDARIDWWQTLRAVAAPALLAAQCYRPPALTLQPVLMSALAQRLRVRVARAGQVVVDLTLPPTALPAIADFMEPETVATVSRRGVDLPAIIQRTLAGGLLPGPVFTLDESDRHVWVWLE